MKYFKYFIILGLFSVVSCTKEVKDNTHKENVVDEFSLLSQHIGLTSMESKTFSELDGSIKGELLRYNIQEENLLEIIEFKYEQSNTKGFGLRIAEDELILFTVKSDGEKIKPLKLIVNIDKETDSGEVLFEDLEGNLLGVSSIGESNELYTRAPDHPEGQSFSDCFKEDWGAFCDGFVSCLAQITNPLAVAGAIAIHCGLQ